MKSSPPVIENISVAIMERVHVPRAISPTCRLNPAAPVVVGLGSNQGAQVLILSEALERMAQVAELVCISRLYQSAAVGPPQPDYLNAAALFDYPGPLSLLLESLSLIEVDLGRVRNERWGPRTLDLDILWAGTRTSSTSSLTVPHIELSRRAFALRPLLDVVPESSDPRSGVPYREILSEVEDQPIKELGNQKWWEAIP